MESMSIAEEPEKKRGEKNVCCFWENPVENLQRDFKCLCKIKCFVMNEISFFAKSQNNGLGFRIFKLGFRVENELGSKMF